SPVIIPSAFANLVTSFLLKAPLMVAPYLKSPALSVQDNTTSTPVFSISPPFTYGAAAPAVPRIGAKTNQSLVVFLYQSAVKASRVLKKRASTPKSSCSEVSQATSGLGILVVIEVTVEVGFLTPK